MNLRPYQSRAIEMLFDWMQENEGYPVLCLPTGSGKSVIIASICKQALQSWPGTRILMLVNSKELIAQNAQKLRQIWPNAPLGVYSASLNKRTLGEPITYAGIGSVRNRASQIGHIDLCIVDECDSISHKNEGGYRHLISQLAEINPLMRVVGLTASPFRMGHGLITDKPAIFDAIIDPVTIMELMNDGYLARLKSKVTKSKLDTTGVHKRGGEFIERELQKAVDKDDLNESIVKEIIHFAEDRRSWLIFCTGVQHAEHIAEALRWNGISAESVDGSMPQAQRDAVINSFKEKKIRALTNCNILSVGFDFPDIDLLVMLRPTMSPRLYLQQAGRGTRLKSHTDHCLVLDFAGVVETHGPITAIVTPDKNKGGGKGIAPTKTCDHCGEIVATAVRICPECGNSFEFTEKKDLFLRDHDIMGFNEEREMEVTAWRWRRHVSKTSGKEMLMVTYYGLLSDKPVASYFPILHENFAGEKARRELFKIASNSKVDLANTYAIDDIVSALHSGKIPYKILYKQDGKFYRVTNIYWDDCS